MSLGKAKLKTKQQKSFFFSIYISELEKKQK